MGTNNLSFWNKCPRTARARGHRWTLGEMQYCPWPDHISTPVMKKVANKFVFLLTITPSLVL